MYYLVGPNDEKYGPADVALLNEWAADNRLRTTSILEEVDTGRRLVAHLVPGLAFPYMPPTFSAAQDSQVSGVYRPQEVPPAVQSHIRVEVFIALAISSVILSPVLSYWLGWLGVIGAVLGVKAAALVVTVKNKAGIPLLVITVLSVIVCILVEFRVIR